MIKPLCYNVIIIANRSRETMRYNKNMILYFYSLSMSMIGCFSTVMFRLSQIPYNMIYAALSFSPLVPVRRLRYLARHYVYYWYSVNQSGSSRDDEPNRALSAVSELRVK